MAASSEDIEYMEYEDSESGTDTEDTDAEEDNELIEQIKVDVQAVYIRALRRRQHFESMYYLRDAGVYDFRNIEGALAAHPEEDDEYIQAIISRLETHARNHPEQLKAIIRDDEELLYYVVTMKNFSFSSAQDKTFYADSSSVPLIDSTGNAEYDSLLQWLPSEIVNETRRSFFSNAHNSKASLLSFLLENGLRETIEEKVNIRGRDHYTLLHRAILNNADLTIVERLLESGADVDKEMDGITPLTKAMYSPNVDPLVVNLLIQYGDDSIINERMILFTVIRDCRDSTVLRLLIEMGADVNKKEYRSSGNTLLHIAIEESNNLLRSQQQSAGNNLFELREIVRILLRYVADVNAKDRKGNTALHLAAQKGNKEIVKILLANHRDIIDVNVINASGQTPFDLVCEADFMYFYESGAEEWEEIIIMLVKHGVEINAQNTSGNTPLYAFLLRALNLSILKMMIEKGADLNSKNELGNTPLHAVISLLIATKKEYSGENLLERLSLIYQTLELLLANEADVKIQNDEGKTPLEYVKESGDETAIHLFESYAKEQRGESSSSSSHSNPFAFQYAANSNQSAALSSPDSPSKSPRSPK